MLFMDYRKKNSSTIFLFSFHYSKCSLRRKGFFATLRSGGGIKGTF